MKNTFLTPKIVSIATAAVAAIAGISSSHAAIVFADSFTLPNDLDTPLIGTSPVIGGAWTITGTSVVNPLTISAASNDVFLNTNGQDANGAFSSPVTKTDGESLTVGATIDMLTVSAAGDYFLHMSVNALSSNFYGRVYARTGVATNTYQLGLASSTPPTGGITWGGDLPIGSAVKIDLTWNFITGALNDTFSLAVTGAPNYIPATAWVGTAAEPTSIGTVNLRQGTAATAPTLRIDNLLVTAIPEPSTALLGAVGLLGLLRRRR
ncbi:MAG: PEP-CTERM sorting domain-containing protein [Verrucomicrobia bacterium]|nr:MAG: PEP-CTERM sorting domain-containing protein [Verrucomicrobiota bacterium]